MFFIGVISVLILSMVFAVDNRHQIEKLRKALNPVSVTPTLTPTPVVTAIVSGGSCFDAFLCSSLESNKVLMVQTDGLLDWTDKYDLFGTASAGTVLLGQSDGSSVWSDKNTLYGTATAGDVLVGQGDGSSVWTDKNTLYGSSSAGQVLTAQGDGSASWQAPASSGNLPYTAPPGNTSLFNFSQIVAANTSVSPVTITLPSASNGTLHIIITDLNGNAAANNVTISCFGSDTVSGGSSLTIDANYGTYNLHSNGIDQWIVA